MEEQWIDKVTLKKHWGIDEARLVEIVAQRILSLYIKHTDGKYYPLPLKREVISNRTEYRTSRLMGEHPVTVRHTDWVDWTKEQIAELLNKSIWFRQIDVDDAEYEGKIKLPEKPQEEMSLSEAGKIGGTVPKRNPAIIEALRIYLTENQDKLDKSNEEISRYFCKKYRDDNACHVTVDGHGWEVECYDKYIFVKDVTGKKKDKSIKSTTLRNYISVVKKRIQNK
jgi:hypothetical protein